MKFREMLDFRFKDLSRATSRAELAAREYPTRENEVLAAETRGARDELDRIRKLVSANDAKSAQGALF